MATQRRFEGNTLAEVLAKVQKEVGPDAKIASAQKIRSGGAMGFFQRERFEVLVDIPDSPPPQPVSPADVVVPDPDPVQSILELANKVSQQDTKAAELLQPARTDATVSTESDAFADVLSRMAFQADMQSADEPVPQKSKTRKPRRQKQQQAQEPMSTQSETIEEPQVVTQQPVAGEPVIPERPAFLDEPVATEPEPVVVPDAEPEPEPIIETEPEPAVADVPVFQNAGTSTATTTPAPVAVSQAPVEKPVLSGQHLPLVPLQQPLRYRRDDNLPMRTRITDHPLASLGLPAPYIPESNNDVVDLRDVLLTTLEERLPKPPVIRPSRGSVIAVVGPREDAVKVARDLAREFGRPVDEVTIASQHVKPASATAAKEVIRTIENAEDAQRSWSRRRRITIVAIDAALGSHDAAWAEHVLTALEPIATFGVADATRKAEDVQAWVNDLGGVDCIALNKVEETVSPASILSTGIPVERIDGRKATPEYWALLLTERLTAA